MMADPDVERFQRYIGIFKLPGQRTELFYTRAADEYIPNIVILLLQKTHRRTNPLEGSMFEDKDGEVLYDFPHVSGFPLESMHVIDGGVIQDIHEVIQNACEKVRLDPSNLTKKPKFVNICNKDVDEMIQFLKGFSLKEQARDLR